MTHDKNRDDDALLDAYFSAARDAEPAPDIDLTLRILADAADVTAERASEEAEDAGPTPGFLSRLAEWLRPIGGVGGAATVAASAVLGIAIGIAGPVAFLDASGIATIAETADFDDALDLIGNTSIDITALEG